MTSPNKKSVKTNTTPSQKNIKTNFFTENPAVLKIIISFLAFIPINKRAEAIKPTVGNRRYAVKNNL